MLYVILYLILIVWGISFAILYTQYTIALFVGILLLFPVITYIFSLIPCMFLEAVIRGTNEAVHKDEEFTVHIVLKNKSIFPIIHGIVRYRVGYQVQERYNKGMMPFQLKGRGESELLLTLKSEYCGAVHIEIDKIVSKDYLNVIPFIKRVQVMFNQPIIPDMDILPLQVTKGAMFYNEEYDEFYEDHPGNDPSEVFEIRDYKEGDKLQRIHWKLSSKRDKLMVKEYSDPIVIATVIIFDNCCTFQGMKRVKAWSTLLEKAVQASYTLIEQGVNHYIYWYDEDALTIRKNEVKSIVDFHACMNQMMLIKKYTNTDVFLNCLTITEGVQNYQNIFYLGENEKRFQQRHIHVKVVE